MVLLSSLILLFCAYQKSESCIANVSEQDESKPWPAVEPMNKGHYGANDFVPFRKVIPISKVK